MVLIYFQLIFAGVLSLVHYYSEKYSYQIERYHSELTSFSAGLFITYIFLYLLPELLEGMHYTGNNIFFLMLIGFVIYHLAEKYLYQHIRNKNELMRDLSELHIAGFFVNHFVTGMILFLALSTEDFLVGLLVFVPLLLHAFSSSLSLNHIDERVQYNKPIGMLLAASPILGVFVANLLIIGGEIFYSLFALATGTLLYVVIRDAIPEDQNGKPQFFVLGFFISYVTLLLVGMFG